ncbi:MAG: YdcF family protein [Rhizobiaceae bacterium]
MTFSHASPRLEPTGFSGATQPAARARRGIWRVLRWTAALCLAGIIAFGGGFGWFAEHVSRMTAPDGEQQADAIIVLTGGHARIDAAVELLKSGKGKRLLISGVHPSAGRNALSAVTGSDPQLFACCVDIDHAALDTIGNAEESAKWVTDHAYTRVILVTNNYHMPRSLLEMRRMIGGVEVIPYPVVTTRIDRGEWLTQPDTLRVLFTEYMKYLAALARGALPGAPHLEMPTLHASAE